jgi:hypothetical protein
MWNLMEVFANLDLAQLAAIVDSDALPSLMAPPLTNHTLVGHTTAGEFYSGLTSHNGTHFYNRFCQNSSRSY